MVVGSGAGRPFLTMPGVEENRPSVAVIGGSGLYRLAGDGFEQAVSTPYGEPSDVVSITEVGGRSVAFLPRHGRLHAIPPHRINHRANLWALQSLGVERVIAPSAVGSLRVEMAPGNVVVCDQFIDHVANPDRSTYFDGPEVAHAAMADPYCPQLRPLAAVACRDAGFTVHDAGTVVVVPGPRFSTRAESRRFRAEGGDLVNMTQYPEVALARELGLCYVNVSLVTDYDTGIEDIPEHQAVTQSEVMEVFRRHTERLRAALVALIEGIGERTCGCAALRPVALGH